MVGGLFPFLERIPKSGICVITESPQFLGSSSNPRPARAWRAEPRGSSIEGDEAKILRTRAPGGSSTLLANECWGKAEGASSMQFQDKMLKCIDCGADFVFTSGEQMFFHDKQFTNEPKRCKACKAKRVANFGAGGGGHRGSTRTETRAICSQCGKHTTVPFRPTQGRPVLCRDCFQQRRPAVSA